MTHDGKVLMALFIPKIHCLFFFFFWKHSIEESLGVKLFRRTNSLGNLLKASALFSCLGAKHSYLEPPLMCMQCMQAVTWIILSL